MTAGEKQAGEAGSGSECNMWCRRFGKLNPCSVLSGELKPEHEFKNSE